MSHQTIQALADRLRQLLDETLLDSFGIIHSEAFAALFWASTSMLLHKPNQPFALGKADASLKSIESAIEALHRFSSEKT